MHANRLILTVKNAVEMIVGCRRTVPNHQEKLLESDAKQISVLHAGPEPKKRETEKPLILKTNSRISQIWPWQSGRDWHVLLARKRPPPPVRIQVHHKKSSSSSSGFA